MQKLLRKASITKTIFQALITSCTL